MSDVAEKVVESPAGPWSFSWALYCLRGGGRVRRRGWTGYIYLDGGYIIISMPADKNGVIVTRRWSANSADMLGDDWEMVST